MKKVAVMVLLLFLLQPVVGASANTVTSSGGQTSLHAKTLVKIAKIRSTVSKASIQEQPAKLLSPKGQVVYQNLVDLHNAYLEIPYLYGGNTKSGLDCSGFIFLIHNEAGLSISRLSSADYFKQAKPVQLPEPGDLVFFENTYKPGISHMGIYLGNQQFVHAGSKGVEITNLSVSYWKDRFVSFKRLDAVTNN